MEYEILVEKNSNGRVIVDFYGIDFDITDEFVNGKCHKVIFGDQIVFVLKGAEIKEEPVENSNTPEETPETHEEVPEPEHSEVPEEKHAEVVEEPEKHDEPENAQKKVIEHSPVETHETEATDNHVGTSEEVHNEEKPVENSENPVVAPEEGHAPVETEEAEEADKKRGKKVKEEATEES